MTLREKSEVLFLRISAGVHSREDAELLRMEAREIYRKLRGGHNSVGHRPSVKLLRRRLSQVACDLRTWHPHA